MLAEHFELKYFSYMSLIKQYRQVESENHLKAHLAKSGGVMEGGLEFPRFRPVQFSTYYDDSDKLSINMRNFDTVPAGTDIYRDVTEHDILAGAVTVLSRRRLAIPSVDQMPKIDRILDRDIDTRHMIRVFIESGW